SQVTPPLTELNTPPLFWPWQATASSLAARGLASMENRLSSEMPLEDCTKCSPPSVERKTANELVPRNKLVELSGRNRNERPASAAVSPMPISHELPPS